MLVLTRKVGEEIVIAGSITVTVLRSRSGQVVLGVEAPRSVPVWRRELASGAASARRCRQARAAAGPPETVDEPRTTWV